MSDSTFLLSYKINKKSILDMANTMIRRIRKGKSPCQLTSIISLGTVVFPLVKGSS